MYSALAFLSMATNLVNMLLIVRIFKKVWEVWERRGSGKVEK